MANGDFTGDMIQFPDDAAEVAGDIGAQHAQEGAPREAADRPTAGPAPGPRRRSARTKIIIAASVVLALLIAAGVVVLILPHVPPVLRPTGLSATSGTYTTAELSWAGPAAGPQPTRYLIFQDGSEIGSVPSSVRTYEVTGLTPATGYNFQVRAIRQHLRSPMSSAVNVSTLTPPPPSAAALTGAFSVNYSHLTWHGFAGKPNIHTDIWNFSSSCPRCSVTLHGAFAGDPFTMTLRPSGAAYTGTTLVKRGYLECGSVRNPYYLTYRLTVRTGAAYNILWYATSWDGKMTLNGPAAQGCVAVGLTARITGTP